jgi:hypothetical protein
MASIPSDSPSDSGFNLILFTIPQSLLLQVGTASLLLLQLASENAIETLQSIGTASEELFRGDRLPILPFPDQNE